MNITRAQFLKLTGAALSGLAATQFNPARIWGAPVPSAPSAKPGQATRNPISMLYGFTHADSKFARPDNTEMDDWFASMKRWGVQRWTTWLNDQYNGKVVPFIADALPGFRDFVDPKEEEIKASHLLRQAALAEKNGIEFWLLIAFPVMPNLDQNIVRRVLPSIYRNGHIDMASPQIAGILKSYIRTLKKRIPNLKGVCFSLGEGNGVISIPKEDVAHMGEWIVPLVRALDEARRELGIGVILNAHQFGLTVGVRRKIYAMTAKFPEIFVMEDVTWPEEDTLHPFMGYLPPEDRDLLFRSNPVAAKFLLDTEYLGHGVWPSVYPRWWKHNMRAAVDAGVKVAMGRVFTWDEGLTNVNFNRLNAHIFAALCRDPGADEKQLLADAAREFLGEGAVANPDLVDLLWETEPVIKDIIGVNGVSPLNHSRFPSGDTIANRKGAMKSVADMFQKPGTILYPPLTDSLDNSKQWRWQNKLTAKPAAEYLAAKQAAAQWAANALARAKSKQVTGALTPEKRKFFIAGYEMLDLVARSMHLYVQAADLYSRWRYDKTVDDATARAEFENLAARLDKLAALPAANNLSYRKDLKAFAEYIRGRKTAKTSKAA